MDDEPMWATDRVVAPTLGFAITIPETANEFAIKGNHLTLIKGNKFDGKTRTDPHKHIHEFLEICDMFKYRDTKNEVVRLMTFPPSLTGEVKTWLDELNEGTIKMWDELQTAFISRSFPQLFSIDSSEKSEPFLNMKTNLSSMLGFNKDFQSRSKQSNLDDDDIPMSREEEAKFMQTFRRSFDHCLNNLDKMLQCCKDVHLVLNWEKCHFMVKEGIMLDTRFSKQASKSTRQDDDMPVSTKDSLKISQKFPRPLTKLLEKDTPFEFNDECQNAFKILKEKLTYAPVIVSSNWSLLFELICDASDFTIGAILGQKGGRNFHPIYFASKTLNATQQNYTSTKKELISVAFAFDKFRSYLVLSKMIVHTYHSALRLCLATNVLERLRATSGKRYRNVAADHLSWIENKETSDDSEDDDNFLGETLLEISTEDEPWFADFANYLASDIIPKGMTYQQKKKNSQTSKTRNPTS
ncbi:reverse transcriptase domain-containing protein [Tanacetum coccineum]